MQRLVSAAGGSEMVLEAALLHPLATLVQDSSRRALLLLGFDNARPPVCFDSHSLHSVTTYHVWCS
jgi:hypothetical protein